MNLLSCWPPTCDRRTFVAGMAAAIMTTTAWARHDDRFFARNELPIGLQLYTLGIDDHGLEKALLQVAAIGYRTVELPGFYGHGAADLRRWLDQAGLKCTSAHVLLSDMADQGRIIDYAHVIGFDRVIIPMFDLPLGTDLKPRPGETSAQVAARIRAHMTPDRWMALAQTLNRTGKALKSHGLRLGYHNHNIELAPGPDGRTALDILLSETDPALVTFEMDAGWVAAAGHDPVEILRRHPGRFELMHVKDITAATKPNYDVQQSPIEVGGGVIDWKKLLPAAYSCGVRRFFVEQEPPFSRSKLDSVKMSFDYLQQLEA